MGKRGFVFWATALCLAGACEEAEPRVEYIEIAAEDRACAPDEACGIVETSCTSSGCECGVAVNEKHLLRYQQMLAQCRGQGPLDHCETACDTPFAKCFEGVCVLSDQPTDLVRRGKSIRELCDDSGGTFVGCPECPPNTRCKACTPCTCPSTHRWSKRGCRKVIKTEPLDVRVEVRPPKVPLNRPLKARVHNDSRRTIWLKTFCGTPFFQARTESDQWETRYRLVPKRRCKAGAIKIARGKSRPFVVKTLDRLSDETGRLTEPGRFRFELIYTDASDDFRYFDAVYSDPFEAVSKRSRR